MNVSTLVFGASSILGYHLAALFPKTITPFISPGKFFPILCQWSSLQLHNQKWLEKIFFATQPKILLYCHAVCDVPKCESHVNWAHEVNVEQVERVLTALPDTVRFVYVSSDHVFGGDGIYTEESPPCPISVYGRTRVEAEQLVSKRPGSLIIRTGLGLGPSPNGRTGHVDWLRYRIHHRLPITIIEDEYRSVVWMPELATRILALAQSPEMGIRHITSTKVVSRVALANFIVELLGTPVQFSIERRVQQRVPHIGRVELHTRHHGSLHSPIPSVLEE